MDAKKSAALTCERRWSMEASGRGRKRRRWHCKRGQHAAGKDGTPPVGCRAAQRGGVPSVRGESAR